MVRHHVVDVVDIAASACTPSSSIDDVPLAQLAATDGSVPPVVTASFGVLVLLLADRLDPVQDFWGVERCGGSVNVLRKYAHATNEKHDGVSP